MKILVEIWERMKIGIKGKKALSQIILFMLTT